MNSAMNSGEDVVPAAIAATSTPETIEGAASLLAEGGSATDAVLSTALAQIASCAGCWVSAAGILSFVHFDAATGTVTSLNGGFNTPCNETNPLSIPRFGQPSGRSVLVPGFPAALFTAHSRFGRISLARVFAHAMSIAEEGFPVDETFARIVRRRRKVLTRLPEGRALFLQHKGSLPEPGHRLHQPLLAETLRAAASTGPEHFYNGQWARQLVAAVRREGGRMTLEDLAAYRAQWTEPVMAQVGQTTVFGPGLPALGGVYLAEALHVAQAAAASMLNDEAAQRLFWLMQITRARYFASFLEPRQRIDPAVAAALWEEIRKRRRFQLVDAIAVMKAWRLHSDAVVAVDRYGNAAALCHSINTLFWGHTGLFVGGVSIPDAAAHQKHAVLHAGPGRRLPDSMNPAIAVAGKEGLLACSAVGASLHEVTVDTLVALLLRGEALDSLATAPAFLSPAWTGLFRLAWVDRPTLGRLAEALFAAGVCVLLPSKRLTRSVLDVPVRVVDGAIAPATIDRIRRSGQRIDVLERDALPTLWVGLAVDRPAQTRTTKIRSSAHNDLGASIQVL